MKNGIFQFDPALVNRARRRLDPDERVRKDAEKAFEELCSELHGRRMRGIEANIERNLGSAGTEAVEHALNLFNDRFIAFFFVDGQVRAESDDLDVPNFEAICANNLKWSIRDTLRWISAAKRSSTVSGDARLSDGEGEESLFDMLSEESVAFGGRSTQVEQIERKDLIAIVKRCVDGMPERKRRLLAAYLEGYTYEEMAAMFGMTGGNVGSEISRMFAAIQKKICKKSGVVGV